MIKLGPLALDEKILHALSEDKLVIFAGAGVSMGPPSNLPSFEGLAQAISLGSGQEKKNQPIDRFLGQLQHQKIPVHERAAQRLEQDDSAPTCLHHNLLKIFRSDDRVRIVTTNFDRHFETASYNIYGKKPEIYRAPALPRGSHFSGIVHVHGALPKVDDLILTDADFGRAYLTEGWARNFLVDVFRNYTVLFVGYSHDDIVMNYLARALPPNSVCGRFALTDQDERWGLLGIQPILFQKTDGIDTFKELNTGVSRLADWAMRGALVWQSRIAEICSRVPPANEEAISEIEQAFLEVHTTRFFISSAKDATWPKWLDDRQQFEALFKDGNLEEKDELLAGWLSAEYAIDHAGELFSLIATHNVSLNSRFWWLLGHEIGRNKKKEIKLVDLRQWISILIASSPDNTDQHVLMWLAERSASSGEFQLVLKLFLKMAEYRLHLTQMLKLDNDAPEGFTINAECRLQADHWELNEVWEKQLKPHLPLIFQSLLFGIANILENIHRDQSAWGKASPTWDLISYRRTAIEPHDLDNYPEAIDVLINACRDALGWLAENDLILLDAWLEQLGNSEIPIFRRLALHSLIEHPQKSANERLSWLLSHMGLNDHAAHHEIYRVLALSFPESSAEIRQILVSKVLAEKETSSDYGTAEENTARVHFEWLEWLERAKPNCPIVQVALQPIKAKYPEWRLSDRPEFTHYITSGWIGHRSPWTVDELLSESAFEKIDDLLSFKGDHFGGPDRTGLIVTLQNACTQKQEWGLELAKILYGRTLWTSDLWSALFRVWAKCELSLEVWQAVLPLAAEPELLSTHSRSVANFLLSLVSGKGKPFAKDLLEQSNAIALALWQILPAEDKNKEIDDWLSSAINRSSGILVEFWIHGLSILIQERKGDDRKLPDNYRVWLTMVVEDQTSHGDCGRSILTSQTGFLFGLDEAWTQQYLIPLFSHQNSEIFNQAWDGFLASGNLYPDLANALTPIFIKVLPRLNVDLSGRCQRFIEFYTALAVFHANDPREKLLPEFLRYSSPENRLSFASHLGYFLRNMDKPSRLQLWNRWLRDYWNDRLQSIPKPLDEAESRKMWEWLPALDEAFPQGVLLVLRSPIIKAEDTFLLHQLSESDLITRFSVDTAKLLIYLSNCKLNYQSEVLFEISKQLTNLPIELSHNLQEALAKMGSTKV